jgi:hypothetical protein
MGPQVPALVDDGPEPEQDRLVDERPEFVIVDDRAEQVDRVRPDVDRCGDAERREMFERGVDRRGGLKPWSVAGGARANSVLLVPAPRRALRDPAPA